MCSRQLQFGRCRCVRQLPDRTVRQQHRAVHRSMQWSVRRWIVWCGSRTGVVELQWQLQRRVCMCVRVDVTDGVDVWRGVVQYRRVGCVLTVSLWPLRQRDCVAVAWLQWPVCRWHVRLVQRSDGGDMWRRVQCRVLLSGRVDERQCGAVSTWSVQCRGCVGVQCMSRGSFRRVVEPVVTQL